MKAKDTLLLNNIITQNPILARTRTRTRTRIYYIKVMPSSGQVCNIHLTKRKTKDLDSVL